MVLLINEAMVDISFGESLIVGIMGYIVVFFGLVLLMFVVKAVGSIMSKKAAKKIESAPAIEIIPAEPKKIPAAKGTAGELKLHNVDPKTAAILMAIVANQMGKPINELRFISIKEV